MTSEQLSLARLIALLSDAQAIATGDLKVDITSVLTRATKRYDELHFGRKA